LNAWFSFYVATGLQPDTLKPKYLTEIKVMTFNVANYNDHGNWEHRRKLIAHQILQANADVVALQELRYGGSSSEFLQHIYKLLRTRVHQLSRHDPNHPTEGTVDGKGMLEQLLKQVRTGKL
jgi:endonuclease/exonuclease/phosphatase family metal-dependent hydrolase